MKKVRKIVSEILKEIFDNPELSKDLKVHDNGEDFLFSFSTKQFDYCVKLKKFIGNEFADLGLTKNEDINKIIKSIDKVYYLNWGVCSSDGNPIDDIMTKDGEKIYVFNSVFAIIKMFIEKNSPDAFFYTALGKRESIYNSIFTKMNIDYNKFDGLDNVFLIKKELS